MYYIEKNVFFLIYMFSARDLTDHLNKCKDTLGDTNIAWEKRVDAVSILEM